MAASKDLSLGELESLYRGKVEHWTKQRAEAAARVDECDRQLSAYEEKLRWVRALIASPEGAVPPPPQQPTKKRGRRAPIKERTYEVLRANPGRWLTSSQIHSAVRKEHGRPVSRQAINVNLNQLTRSRKIRRRRAPRGSGGAHYVYTIVKS